MDPIPPISRTDLDRILHQLDENLVQRERGMPDLIRRRAVLDDLAMRIEAIGNLGQLQLVPTGRFLPDLLRRLLNMPIRFFARKQILLNHELQVALSTIAEQIELLHAQMPAIPDHPATTMLEPVRSTPAQRTGDTLRICLLSLTYPPASTEGIPRQRQTLARALARRGHEVHVVTLGPQQQWDDGGVTVHQCPVRPTPYHVADSGVATALRRSQALYEGVCNAQGDRGFDILDVPLWAAQGFATLYRAAPVVLWLQTSTAQLNQLSYGESPAGRRMLAALEGVCVTRAAALLSDSYAALAAIHSNYEVDRTIPTAVAHLGLPVQEAPAERRLRPVVEALVVGRLERRKGTALLFDLLPDLLQRCPMLQVRFVGHDNSANDGWQLTMGADYPTTFRHRYPHLSDRVYFDGYVSETELTQRYATADLLVAPSLYE
ncbi:MAG TPA: glycosyltransferase family 4 protein, partial [Roseiflexaceae bacterium]|nr:glycosyltransferase family 4 protein [Roseiflexaceae bacterium]